MAGPRFGDKIKWNESITNGRDSKIKWDDNTYKWDDIRVLIKGGAAADTGATTFEDISRDWTEGDKKKLVKVVCRINGIHYEDEKWKKSASKVNATQVKIAVSKVLGVKIDI